MEILLFANKKKPAFNHLDNAESKITNKASDLRSDYQHNR